MEASQRRKLDKFQREVAFMNENAAEFPDNSPGDVAANLLTDVVTEIETLAAQQISGADDSRQHFGVKEELYEDLMEKIRDMNRAANAFADEIQGIEDKFRLPRNRSQQNILSTAVSFHTDSEPHNAKFIEYGLDTNFRADLLANINAVRQRDDSGETAGESRGEATGGLIDAFRRGTEISRKLDAIVKIKYRSNPGKLAAWAIASHLDRAPQRAPKLQPA